MKYMLGLIVGMLFSVSAMAELPSNCPTPEGCDWRSTITIVVKNAAGEENWITEWTGPAMGYIDNVKHNYLLLEHIFSRDPGSPEPAMMSIARELAVPAK